MGSILIRSGCPCCGSITIGKVMACKDYTVSGEIFDVWECDYCSIRFTQNIPDQDSIGPFYQSDTYISHTDTEKGLINKIYKIARNYTLRWKMNLVKNSLQKGIKKGVLLDIGCGTGAFISKVFSEGWSVLGLEPDEGARRICEEKYSIQTGEPQKLFELPDATFDAVTMWHVLEHVHQLHDYIEQIKRVLKRNGVALIALPNYTSYDAHVYQEYWAAYDVPRHLYHFAPKAMDKLAELHEMKVESLKPMWLDAFYISLLSNKYQHGKSNPVSAVWNGLRSNINALNNTDACSSLVYVIRHRK